MTHHLNSWLAQLGLAAMLASCSHPTVPSRSIPTAPPRSANVLPAVEAVRTTSAASSAAAAMLESQVSKLRQASSEMQTGMTSALAEADRLRRQKSASESELIGMWEKLTDLNTRNLFLEAEAEQAVKFANEQKNLRVLAEEGLASLSQLAADHDSEILALRLQHDDMSRTITEQALAYELQSAALIKAESNAGISKAIKAAFWIILGAVALYVVGRIAVKTYFPALKILS